MLHLIKYRSKCMLKNKTLLFWTLAFPLILTTLFASVLRDVYEVQPFETIKLAVIDTKEYQQNRSLQALLQELQVDGENMFEVKIMNQKDGEQALQDDEVDVVLLAEDTLKLSVRESDITTTIASAFFQEYEQQSAMVEDLIQKGVSIDTIQAQFQDTQEYIVKETTKNDELNAVFFYTILAMNCLFGGYWSINSMFDIQANQSTRGARMAVAPLKKSQFLLCDFLLTMCFEIAFIVIIMAYMMGLLDIAFGNQYMQIALLLLFGSFAGNAIGTLIGVTSTRNDNFKSGILTTITLSCSFLAGMMMIQVKYIVQLYAPIVNIINPVNMITDGLYALYFYGVGDRYYFNLISLFIVIVLGYGCSLYMIRKKQYTSLEAR